MITLLKHPYPYQAALTVCSDTHATPIETFEAVHTLINTDGWIARGSDAWSRLFVDPEIDRREEWREGVRGFGLPIADTLWLYSPGIGVFERYDEAAGAPVPHRVGGRDMREVVDEWLRKGWVDSLHTPGPGRITREATAAGLRWLAGRPHGRLRVYVNHSLEKTPSCLEPDGRALRAVVRNLARAVRIGLARVGLDAVGRRLSSTDELRPFPPGQAALLWTLAAALVASGFGLAAGLAFPALRSAAVWLPSALVLLGVTALLQALPARYAQGDNPGSPFYIADLLRDFGFRFFWFIKPQPGYQTHVDDTLALPESSCGGRASCLRKARLDDGSEVLVFGRVYKDSPAAWFSLQLFSEELLEALVAQQGTGIVYTHWTFRPHYAFNARALDSLARLQRFHRQKQVWVAPTAEVLRFAHLRAFLEYDAESRNGRHLLRLHRLNDPVSGPLVPSLAELRGLSFELPDDLPVDVELAGRSLGPEAYERVREGGRVVLRFPLEPSAPTTDADGARQA